MADRSVSVYLRARVADFKRGMREASQATGTLSQDLLKMDARGEKARRGLNSIGDTAGKVGLAAAAGMAVASKAAADWEVAWTGVTKTVDGSGEQMRQLEEDLRSLARETGFAHEEVAAVAEAAGQLGISTGGVSDFTRTMLDMGVSTDLAAGDAATGLARLRNIMGTTEGEIQNTGSAMVELGNNFETTEPEILAMSLRLAGAGRQAGLSTPDVLGLATAMSSVGIEAEAGGTAMSLTMKRIGREVETGGDKLGLFAQTAGMSVEDFAEAWGDDAPGALADFVAGLDQAERMGMSTNEVLRELGITGVREADALLRLSGNAEGLADALGAASEGFAENNALAEEAGQFYGTTGQQVKQAWAEITDAAIEAGDVLLPIIAEAAEGVGDFANAFGKLPDPAQKAVVALGGITAVLGGGLWFTSKVVNGVTDMKQALSDLGFEADATKGKLSRAAAAGTAFAVVAASIPSLISDYDSWQRGRDAMDASAASLEDLTEILSESNLGKYAGDLGIDVQRLAQDLHVNGKEGEYASQVLGELSGKTDEFGDKAKSAAGDWLPFWTGEAKKAWDAQEDLGNILDTNADLLGSGADATKEAAREALGLSEADADLAEQLGVTNEELAAQKEALEQSREAASETANSFFTLGDSLDDGKKSLGQWLRELEQQAASLRNFRKNAETAADKGLRQGLIAALQEAGPAGALRMRQLADASRKEIRRANEAWQAGQRQVGKYIDEVGGVPSDVSTNVHVNGAREGISALRGLSSWLRDLNGDTANTFVNTYEQRVILPAKNLGSQLRAANSGNGALQADGSVLDFYADGDIRNGHVAQIAPAGAWRVWAEEETGGEAYIPLAPSKRDRSLDIWAETGRRLGALESFADGDVRWGAAAVDRISTRPFSSQLDWLRSLEKQARGFERALERSESALEKERRQRDDLIRQRDSLRSAVRGRLTSDPFGAMDEGGLSDLFSTLRGDIRSGVEFKRATRTLRRRGLDGAALQSVLESGDPSDFAALTQPQLREYERLFNRRQRVTSAAGGFAGAAVFGAEVRAQSAEVKAQTAELREARRELRQMQRVIEKNGDRIEDGARKGTREGISGRDRRDRQRVGNS